MFGKLPVVLLTLAVCVNQGFASPEYSPTRINPAASFERRENDLRVLSIRKQGVPPLTSATPRMTCEQTVGPEALATPRMLVNEGEGNAKIIVSFVIGTDGRVHSPLILQSTDDRRDAIALTTIRSWKFRPATCNGIPTEADGTVEFSRR